MLDPRWVVTDGRHRFLSSRDGAWSADLARAIVFRAAWDATRCQQAHGGLVLPYAVAVQVAPPQDMAGAIPAAARGPALDDFAGTMTGPEAS